VIILRLCNFASNFLISNEGKYVIYAKKSFFHVIFLNYGFKDQLIDEKLRDTLSYLAFYT